MEKEYLERYQKLKEYIKDHGCAAVAFSGGVDSSFLLYAAYDALGGDAFALTAASVFTPERELSEAKEFCEKRGIRQIVFNADVLALPGVSDNPPDRCYLCKKGLFSEMKRLAEEKGSKALCEGSNLDDTGDYRPGLKAISELGILSPLRECGFTKAMIRKLSEHFLLPTWNKPSFACLASRVPYGDPITKEKLAMVDRAEQCLINFGFDQMRVRAHGNLARIEVPKEDIQRFFDASLRDRVVKAVKEAGFAYVSLDLSGYRTGSLNEVLKK